MSTTAAMKPGTARPATTVDPSGTPSAVGSPGTSNRPRGDEPGAGPAVAAVKDLAATMTTSVAKSLSQQDRRGTLTDVDDAIGKLQLVRTRLIAAEDVSRDWVADGDKNLETWLGRSTRSGYGPAKTEVDMARTLQDLPIVGNAFEAGTITVEHVKATSRQYAHASGPQRHALTSSQGQQDLVTKARDADAGRFTKQLARDLARIDAAKLERDRAAVKKRRYVKLSNRTGGVQLEGFLDPVAGEYLRTALDAATARPAIDDMRTPAQQRADALTGLAKHALDSGSFKPGGNVRPHVMVTLSAAEWADWQRTGRVPSAAPAATVGDGTPVAPSELETLLCDCTVMRAVLDTDGQPVDLGRDKRTFTAHMRKALQLRDGHCTWPGCTMPGGYTEGHHIAEWAASGTAPGGKTSIDNGILLCSYHHHFVHARNMTITPIAGGHRFEYPDGRIAGEHHFNNGPPPDWAVGPSTGTADRSQSGGLGHAGSAGHAGTPGRSLPGKAATGDSGGPPPGRDHDPPPELPLE